MSEEKLSKIDLLNMTTDIVSAHVSNNKIEPEKVGDFIHHVYCSLVALGDENALEKILPDDVLTPAVPVHQSVMDDHIICLEDGKKMKMLKRYLKSTYDMTPEQYREKWGLSPDYPMVAPSYAKKRSRLAREMGLGTVGRNSEDEA